MFRCEFVPPPDPMTDVLKERLKRLRDMERAHGEVGALLVLGALWTEAQHSARFFPDEAVPVTSYRVRSSRWPRSAAGPGSR